MKKYTRVLSIAGSDSGGGAGIQADLKTIGACGGYGMTVVTALTAQNTLGVRSIQPVPVEFIEAQFRAIAEDIGIDCVKIGMLHSSEVIETVARLLTEYKCEKIVLDPVMVATSGDPLIEKEALHTLVRRLIPAAGVITPNIPEAEILVGKKILTEDDLEASALKICSTFSVSVLLKAGHFQGNKLKDLLVVSDAGEIVDMINTRVDTSNTHGTGCTLSSAIATFWGCGEDLVKAVEKAERYLREAIRRGADYSIGAGHGPVHHFHAHWD